MKEDDKINIRPNNGTCWLF